MLAAVEIENFKGIGSPIRIELRPITLLFGPNSAGKSTILHALHYAHEILSRRNFDADQTHHGGDFVDLGGFRTFVHAHDTDRVLRLRFELDLSGSEMPELPLPGSWVGAEWEPVGRDEVPLGLELYNDGLSDKIKAGSVEFTLCWSTLRDAPVVRSYEVSLDGESVGRIEASTDGAQVELIPNIPHPLFAYDGRTSNEPEDTTRNANEPWRAYMSGSGIPRLPTLRLPVAGLSRSSLPMWGKLLEIDERPDVYGYPFREFLYRVSTLLVGVGSLVRDELSNFRYLGPMRDVLPRMYKPPRFAELARWANGFAAWDLLLARGDDFTQEVSTWLSREDGLATGYGLQMRSFKELPEDSPLMIAIRQGRILDDVEDLTAEIVALPSRQELLLVDSTSGLAVHPSDVGVGISQVLPVVVAALDRNRPGITAIEQPELHIHPKVQVELADLFAHQVCMKDLFGHPVTIGSGTFLLETHSEHLMLRLLRRIEETHSGELPPGKPPLGPNQVSVVFIEQVEGEVRATPLRIDETGEFIDRWPRGFFEERAKELL